MVESSSAPLFGVFVYRNGFTIRSRVVLAQKPSPGPDTFASKELVRFLIGTPRATFAQNPSRLELILPHFPADDLSITLINVCIDNKLIITRCKEM